MHVQHLQYAARMCVVSFTLVDAYMTVCHRAQVDVLYKANTTHLAFALVMRYFLEVRDLGMGLDLCSL